MRNFNLLLSKTLLTSCLAAFSARLVTDSQSEASCKGICTQITLMLLVEAMVMGEKPIWCTQTPTAGFVGILNVG